eukprot:360286-Chlamydomonas_euryale.AAC.1
MPSEELSARYMPTPGTPPAGSPERAAATSTNKFCISWLGPAGDSPCAASSCSMSLLRKCTESARRLRSRRS